MKKTIFSISALVLGLGILIACESKFETDTDTPTPAVTDTETVTDEKVKEPTHDSKQEDPGSEKDADSATPSETLPADKETAPPVTAPAEESGEAKNDSPDATTEAVVTSGDAAIQHLKAHWEDGMNEDIAYGTDGSLEKDEHGSYYTVRLISISLRLAGGTGSLDTFKVYQDGTYKPY